jgi:hypothetical protein
MRICIHFDHRNCEAKSGSVKLRVIHLSIEKIIA